MSICLSAFFAVLAIVCVHVLSLQERRVSVYTFGGRNLEEKGVLWSSKKMKVFIVALIGMFVVSISYLVLEIGATWSLCLWYRDLLVRISTRHSLVGAHTPCYASTRSHSTACGNFAQYATDDLVSGSNEAAPNDAIDRLLDCPGTRCLNLKAISFIVTEACVCDPKTIFEVHRLSKSAVRNFYIALGGASGLFVGMLMLGMLCALAAAQLRLRIDHWEQFLPSDLEGLIQKDKDERRHIDLEAHGDGVWNAEGEAGHRANQRLPFPDIGDGLQNAEEGDCEEEGEGDGDSVIGVYEELPGEIHGEIHHREASVATSASSASSATSIASSLGRSKPDPAVLEQKHHGFEWDSEEQNEKREHRERLEKRKTPIVAEQTWGAWGRGDEEEVLSSYKPRREHAVRDAAEAATRATGGGRRLSWPRERGEQPPGFCGSRIVSAYGRGMTSVGCVKGIDGAVREVGSARAVGADAARDGPATSSSTSGVAQHTSEASSLADDRNPYLFVTDAFI